MFRNLSAATLGGLLLVMLFALPASAFDEEAGTLSFIDPDTPLVMAMDVDEVMAYARSVGRDWREADTARFFDSLDIFSNILASEADKPDVLTFFSRLAGVQAVATDGSTDFPLIIFNGDSTRDLGIMALYTQAYIVDARLSDSFDVLQRAIFDYYYRELIDSETGEEYYPYSYPATLDDLIEEGYLDAIPINPYTGEPIRVIGPDDEGRPGDVMYMPRADDEDPEVYSGYDSKFYRIYGITVPDCWGGEQLEAYEDLSDRLGDFGREYDPADMGFNVDTDGDWMFMSRDDAEYAFAYGDTYLLFGPDVDTLMAATERYTMNEGFRFRVPDDFDVSDAYYLDQTYVPAVMEGTMTNMMTGFGMASGMGMPPGQMMEEEDMEDMDDKDDMDDMEDMESMEQPDTGEPDIMGAMQNIFGTMGFESMGYDITAFWLEDSNIIALERTELTGDAEGTYISALVNAEPEELMTAQGGPVDIIAQMAWANPDDWVHAYMKFIFEDVFPEISEAVGSDEMDPEAILSMMGIGNVEDIDIGDQLYLWFTSSEEREGGIFVPGLNVAMSTESEDIAYMAVGVMDTLSFMVPDFPFILAHYGDENAYTWTCECEELPITPTIAWTDGWMIKGLWRDDVLAIRDAIEAGEMFTPDGLEPANMRFTCNRQDLLRAFADVAYMIDKEGVPFAGAIFELLAQLSDPEEMVFMEVTSHDGYVEKRMECSIDLFENMLPLMNYLLKGIETVDF